MFQDDSPEGLTPSLPALQLVDLFIAIVCFGFGFYLGTQTNTPTPPSIPGLEESDFSIRENEKIPYAPINPTYIQTLLGI